jgi:hypothetical protein
MYPQGFYLALQRIFQIMLSGHLFVIASNILVVNFKPLQILQLA